MKHLGKHFTPWPLTCSGEYPGENGSKAALVDPRFYTRCPFTPRFEETRGNMCTLPQPKTKTRFLGKTFTPSPCAKRTGGRRSPPSSLRELGVRFSPAFRRNAGESNITGISWARIWIATSTCVLRCKRLLCTPYASTLSLCYRTSRARHTRNQGTS
jgi:hypothetical protein